ncbi:M20 family metallopeptidase [Desulfatitalea tepidiphila]|uniref:M20 family metallopeptidase n=1 Tax=Desulfatitalea tepidiphila TaxID=1185843 RepID=UPI0006B5829F|nr:M20 family metallopeptidase [Desulfatitalea tepidiphila]
METKRFNDLYRRFEDLLPPEEPLEMAKRLIAFQSENPPGMEAEISEYLEKWLSAEEFEVSRVLSPQGRPNLVATLRAKGGGKRLIYNGHMDVVPAGDPGVWTSPPYAPEIRSGRLYGRGAADTKGGTAAFIYGAWLIKQAGLNLGHSELVLHLVSDEESGGSHGTGFLASKGLAKADAAVVVEPTGMKIATAEKGTLWYRITIKGVAAHAAVPHLGVNAIEKMGKLLPRLKDMIGETRHPILGEPTLSIGVISGGSKINTVADSCFIEVDRRCLPNEQTEVIEQRLEDILADFGKNEEIKLYKERLMYAEPSEIAANEKIVTISLSNIERVIGNRPEIFGISGFTDARYYMRQAGTPAILLGPGNMNQAHTTDEYVEVDQLRRSALIFALITADFLDLE